MKNQDILRIAAEELIAARTATTNGENYDRLARARFKISERMTSSGGTATVGGKNTGLVKLSGPIARNEGNTEADLRNTIRHELAHIAVGAGQGHGPVWKRQSLAYGCTGSRTHSMACAPTKRRARFDWTVSCACCGHEIGTLRNRTTVAKWIGNRRSTCCRSTMRARKVV
jgi:predicted SprT family Zn-dependent metalloprotease